MNDIISKFVSRFFDKKTTCCPVCGADDLAFNPLPEYYHNNAMKHGCAHFGKGEMTALETYSCAKCGASDRERLCAYWINLQLERKIFSKEIKVIHFAPEPSLSNELRKQWLAGYKTADLEMEGCDYKVDMMQLPFEDESYDFFICNHVLEHVRSDDKAIAELYRITKTGGRGVLLAPISTELEHTLEDPSITDEKERWRYYGQNDHVRLYAHDDYVKKIKSHGFTVQELGESNFGKRVFNKLGLKRTSVLYVVNK